MDKASRIQPYAEDIETNERENNETVNPLNSEEPIQTFDTSLWDNDYPAKPLPKSEVLQIPTTPEFDRTHDLIYQVMQSGEVSKRVHDLTSAAIDLNSSNPTTWMLRRKVVIALAETEGPSIWQTELAYTASIITKSSKNYQAWEHRRFCVEKAGLLEVEIQFIDIVLADSPKNYHAWSHRQWLVREHGLVEDELEATKWYIQFDVRDNSAWNHRWLVTGLVDGARDIREMRFALETMKDAPRNESVWNYIHALGKHGVDLEEAKAAASECVKADPDCVPARRFLILNGKAKDAIQVRSHCEILGNEVDVVRKSYWQAQYDAAEAIIRQQEP